MDYRFSSADGQLIIGARGDGTEVLIEPGQAEWDTALASSPAPYVAPALPDPLEAERAGMVASRFQTRAALYVAGLLPIVEAAVGKADPLTKMAWAEAVEFRRASPTIAKLAAALALDDAQLDDLFRAAMKIEV